MKWISRFLFFTLIMMGLLTVSVYLQGLKKAKSLETIALPSKKSSICHPCFKREDIGEGIFGLSSQRLKKRLQSSIIFLGINDRADYQNPVLHFSFESKAQSFESFLRWPLSLLIDEADAQNYTFKVYEKEKQAHFEIFSNTELLFSFNAPPSQMTQDFYLDNFKIDSYLLVRQKVAWLGQDQFLKDFGGEEYSFAQDAERLDFMHLAQPYSLFVKPNSLLSWKSGRWQVADQDSRQYPLMKVEQISGKTMKISLWDLTGLRKENILLSLSGSQSFPASLLPFKFIGARSAHKWLLKFNKERLSVEPGDWLIHLGHKWEKVTSSSAIEQYVQRLNLGELFVIESLKEEEGKKYLCGHLYHSSRTQKQDYKINLSRESKK